MTMAHDLLTEPLLSWRDAERRRGKTTLPGLLARLASGELADFPRVRSHQFHPWSMFLTQLAAIALHRAGRTDPKCDEGEWRELLLALTEGEHEPWCLVVGDLEKPAFMQPPVPKGSGKSEREWVVDPKSSIGTPDDLDILVTSKSHDVKQARVVDRAAEQWAYALVNYQTMQGYPGRGYTPISRMKGGYGNRPRVGLSKSHSISARFERDLGVLLNTWPGLIERGFSDGGLGLVWTEDWDGATSLGAKLLCPHFIEVCARLRCRKESDHILCAMTTSSTRRCLPEMEKGDVGDPWIPIDREGGALTVGPSGFHYDLLGRLLLESDFIPAAAQSLGASDGELVLFLATALARGQGKTEGLHERVLVLAGEVRRRLGQPDQRSALGRRASAHVALAEKMRSKVLFGALKKLALGEKTPADGFDARVDDCFFVELFGSLETDDAAAKLKWERGLAALARGELQAAIDRCCLSSAKRYRAIADAESQLNFNLWKQFPDLVEAERSEASLELGAN